VYQVVRGRYEEGYDPTISDSYRRQFECSKCLPSFAIFTYLDADMREEFVAMRFHWLRTCDFFWVLVDGHVTGLREWTIEWWLDKFRTEMLRPLIEAHELNGEEAGLAWLRSRAVLVLTKCDALEPDALRKFKSIALVLRLRYLVSVGIFFTFDCRP